MVIVAVAAVGSVALALLAACAVRVADGVQRARAVLPGRSRLGSAIVRAVRWCTAELGNGLLLADAVLLRLPVLTRAELAAGALLVAVRARRVLDCGVLD